MKTGLVYNARTGLRLFSISAPTMARTINLGHHNVPITLPDGLPESTLASFRPFQNWIDTLARSIRLQADPSHPFHPDPYTLRAVTIQSFDLFGGDRLGFVKIQATLQNNTSETLPAIALLRGPTVAILVMLVPDDAPAQSNERYVVLTVQPRIPAGSLGFVELPAGMVDDSGTFKSAAAKEIEEELGITIREDELTCLSDLAVAEEADAEALPHAMYPSAGGCDEHVTIYSYERRIPRSQLHDWSGRLTGLRCQGEKITLKVVPMEDLWRVGARDAKALGALALWDGLKKTGRV